MGVQSLNSHGVASPPLIDNVSPSEHVLDKTNYAGKHTSGGIIDMKYSVNDYTACKRASV